MSHEEERLRKIESQATSEGTEQHESAELSDEDLEKVAGGSLNSDKGSGELDLTGP